MGLLEPETMSKYQKEHFPEYSAEDKATLKAKYTPEQIEALEAGEKAIDTKDMAIQGRLRDDAYRPNYIEDYTVMDPRYDVRPEVEGTPRDIKWPTNDEWMDNYGDSMRKLGEQKSSAQLTRAMVRALRKVKESQGEELIDLTNEELTDLENNPELLEQYLVDEDISRKKISQTGAELLTEAQVKKLDEAVDEAWKKELDTIVSFTHSSQMEPSSIELIQDGPAGTDQLNTAEAPELGKVPGVEGLYKHAVDPEDEGQDDSGKYQEIKRLTGMSLKEIRSILSKALVIRRVANQTRLGKVRSTSVLAIAGNGNGRLGLGMAKSTEPGVAEETAQMLAIRNMKPIRRYENRTVYGNISAKVSGTVVELYARPPGKSIIRGLQITCIAY